MGSLAVYILLKMATIVLCTCTYINSDVTWSVTSLFTTEYRDENGTSYIKEDHQVSLVCSYHSLDHSKLRYLRWNKVDPENPLSTEQIYFSQNNEQITGSLQGRAIIDIQDGSTQIKILNFNTSLDATTYQCIVCDTDITCQSSILDINGIELLELPKVKVSGPDITVTEGGHFSLVCSVHGGYPTMSPFKYSWTFQSIYEDTVGPMNIEQMDYLIQHIEENSTVFSEELTFMNVSYHHYGLFQCFADVVGGRITNSINVTVYYSPLLMDTGEDDTFYKPIGSSLTLHLSFRSHSKFNTSVNWTHIANDEVYKELEYSLIHVKNQLHSCSTSVEIDNIGITDFGVYRCLMYNGLLSTVEKQFQLYIDLPSIDQNSLVYSKKDSVVSLSWDQPEGPYTGVSILKCRSSMVECTEYKVADSERARTLSLSVDANIDHEYYLILYQNGVEVYRSEKFTKIEEKNDSVYGIIAGITAAVIVSLVVVVPLCVIKLMGCRRKDKEVQENISSKQKIHKWVTRLRKSFKRSKTRRKSMTDMTLSDIEEESVSKDEKSDSISTQPLAKSSAYSVERPRTELKLIPRRSFVGQMDMKDSLIFSNKEKKQSDDNVQASYSENTHNALTSDVTSKDSSLCVEDMHELMDGKESAISSNFTNVGSSIVNSASFLKTTQSSESNRTELNESMISSGKGDLQNVEHIHDKHKEVSESKLDYVTTEHDEIKIRNACLEKCSENSMDVVELPSDLSSVSRDCAIDKHLDQSSSVEDINASQTYDQYNIFVNGSTTERLDSKANYSLHGDGHTDDIHHVGQSEELTVTLTTASEQPLQPTDTLGAMPEGISDFDDNYKDRVKIRSADRMSDPIEPDDNTANIRNSSASQSSETYTEQSEFNPVEYEV